MNLQEIGNRTPQKGMGFCLRRGKMDFVLCTAGFVLCLLYDWNSVRPVCKIFGSFFALGCACLAAGTAALLWYSRDALLPVRTGSLFALAGVVIALAGLVYTLFFALPFSATYVQQSTGRKAYTEGIYALCRHPGVLWLGLAYLCLAFALGTGRSWAFFAAILGMDIGYVVFQDLWTFPKTFCNYEQYRQTTPFLWPTAASIGRCIRTLRGGT